MTRFIISFIFILLIINVNAQEDRLVMKNITNADGLSSNRVNCFLEDQQGLMWIGTHNGLDLYDGNTIKHLYKDFPVLDMIEDPRNGNLYLGTSVGLVIFDKEKRTFSRKTLINSKGKKFGMTHISTLCINKDHELLVSSLNRLYILNPTLTDFELIIHETDKKKNKISAILVDKKGQTLIGCNKGIFTLDRKKKKLIPARRGQNIYDITKFFEDSQNNLWVCTYTTGLQFFKNGDLNKKPRFYSIRNGMLNNKTRDIIEVEKNKFLILNRNEGLVYFDRNTNKTKNYVLDKFNPNGLPSKALTTLFKDSKNNIWIGTLKNGFCFIDEHRKKFELFKMNFKDDGLINNNISSFLEDAQGNVWVGTDNGGGLSKFNKEEGTFENYIPDMNNPHGLHDEYILCIEELDDQHLLLGTLKKGIEIFNKKTKQFSHYPINSKNESETSIFYIKKDIKGNIWASGSEKFYLFHINTGKYETIHKLSRIKYIEQTHEDSIWLSTYLSGLLRFNINNRRIQRFPTSPRDSIIDGTLSSNSLTFVKKDSKNNLWIGTNGAGINFKKANSNTFTHYTDRNLLHANIMNILFENDSTLWISSSNGLAKFNVNDNSFRHFNVKDGLQGNEFGLLAALKTKKGDMYFGGRNGFNVFNPKKIADNTIKPNIVFSDFKLFNKSMPIDTINSPLTKHISQTKTLTLNHEQTVMTFAFVATNYSSPEKNQYAYMLEGFDNDWNYIGNKKEATYTNLPAGEYTLKVKASNNDNVWNEKGISLDLIIMPPWWNTWWFKVISAITIFGGILLLFIVRLRKMNARQKDLEEKVDERTKDLQEANIVLEESREEISQQNDQLEIKQSELITKQSELEARNTELAEQKNEVLKKNMEIEIKNTVLEEQKIHLKEKNDEITKAYHIVEEKNNNIKASISYAKTIQTAILPSPAIMDKAFNNFVVFRPKDIVSGDFYWMSRIDKTTSLVAAVDCTGHGVPGAFMSMIGSRLLNSIVIEQKVHSPKEILSEMHIGIQKALKQDTSENDDGMDVCLCKIETKEAIKITFAGAKRPLYHFDTKANKIKRIKGCINPIGGNYHLNEYPYQNTEIELNKGDSIYLTSDGYMDQNNSDRKSFGATKFNQLLANIALLPLDQQKTKMEDTLNLFMEGEKQRDDIVIIGIKP